MLQLREQPTAAFYALFNVGFHLPVSKTARR